MTAQNEQQKNEPNRILEDIRRGAWLKPSVREGRANEQPWERDMRLKTIAETKITIEEEWRRATTSTDPSEVVDLAARYEILKTSAPSLHPDFCQDMVNLLLARARELDTPMNGYLDKAKELSQSSAYKSAPLFYDYAFWRARTFEDYLKCFKGWRGYPVYAVGFFGQENCLKKAEKIATSIQEWLALPELWAELGDFLKSTAPILKCLRAAEKIAATPAELLDCGTTALMALPHMDGTSEMRRLYKKAVSFAACGKDWGYLAGAFMEESDAVLDVMPKWRARFDTIRGVPFTATQVSQVTQLTAARSAEEAGKSTSDFLQALTLYFQASNAGQATHFERILGKAESAAKTAHELAACAIARFDCGWATLPVRLQKAKNAFKKGIGLAHSPEDWQGLMAGAMVIAEKILRQEKGMTA